MAALKVLLPVMVFDLVAENKKGDAHRASPFFMVGIKPLHRVQ